MVRYNLEESFFKIFGLPLSVFRCFGDCMCWVETFDDLVDSLKVCELTPRTFGLFALFGVLFGSRVDRCMI